MSAHPVLWTSPNPLWGRFGAVGRTAYAAGDQKRPSILRFATDDFMDDLLAMLAVDPRRIGEVIARPETWRTEVGATPDLVARVPLPRIARALARVKTNGASSTAVALTTHEGLVTENSVERTVPLKLYHPAHQRHYLVTANLVCGIPGFPDRAVASGGREQVGYVLRRLLLPPGVTDESKREEFAFLKDASGARWQRVTPNEQADDAAAVIVDGEEMLPLFPLAFRDDTDHPRRMFGGLIPVGRRDEYMGTRAHRGPPTAIAAGASAVSSIHSATVISARKEQFKNDVAEPWKNLIRTAFMTAAMMNDPATQAEWLKPATPSRKQTAAKKVNERLQGESWLILLDFADYLFVHLPHIWEAVETPSKGAAFVGPDRHLFDFLNNAPTPTPNWQLSGTQAPSLRAALAQVRGFRNTLERTTRSFPEPGPLWPTFRFLLAGVQQVGTTFSLGGPYEALAVRPTSTMSQADLDAMAGFELGALRIDKLVALIVPALDKTQGAPAPAVPFAARLRDALMTTQHDEGWFVIRCAYVRCDCGPLDPTLMSAPSQRFQLASFFDSDAPARPIQISLPLDTTPAGMRRHAKGTAFVISDVLCGQVERAKALGLIDLVRSVLPWPLHKDLDLPDKGPCTTTNGNPLGMICSLSIPIVTICALILLLIIVSLLDIVFKWMPLLIFCFPVPGLKAKPVKEPS